MKKCMLFDQTESKKLIIDADAVEVLNIVYLLTLKDKFDIETYCENDVPLHCVTSKLIDGEFVRITYKDIADKKEMRVDMGYMNFNEKDNFEIYTEILSENGLPPLCGLQFLKKTIESQPGYKDTIKAIIKDSTL